MRTPQNKYNVSIIFELNNEKGIIDNNIAYALGINPKDFENMTITSNDLIDEEYNAIASFYKLPTLDKNISINKNIVDNKDSDTQLINTLTNMFNFPIKKIFHNI